MTDFEPGYRKLFASGELDRRAEEAYRRLERCDCCGWSCKANRLAGKHGACWTGVLAQVSSYGPHMGEEKPLRGWRGSGTIFFAHCNMRCVYCQNYDISHGGDYPELSSERLAGIMLELQAMGCHNINLVSPSHVVPQILAAVAVAAREGLRLPLVYNTGGYDSMEMLHLLDGVIDIYMPDMKYANDPVAFHYSRIHNYPKVNQENVREMHRQVGDLQIDENGLATRGLLVRHLILPNGVAGTREIVDFLAEEISTQTYLNLMDQYHPCNQARQYTKLSRRITRKEFVEAVEMAHRAGLSRLDGE